MMRLALCTLVAASLSAGCGSGDALVVVTVTAAHDLSGIQSLQVNATAHGRSKMFSVSPAAPPFELPPEKSFGVDVPEGLTGMFSITIDAVDASSKTLASGAEMTTTSAGKRTDLTVTLGAGGGDGALDANLDGNADANPNADLTCVPQSCTDAGYGCGTLTTCGQMVDCGPCSVTSVHPLIANTGDTITLEGRFNPTIMVVFPGGATVAATALGPNRATVVVPAGASAGTLSVSDGGTVAGLKHFFRRATFAMSLGDFRQNYEQADTARPMPQLTRARDGAGSFATGETMVVLGGQPQGSPSPEPTIEEADISADGSIGTFGVQGAARMPVIPRQAFAVYNPASGGPYIIGGLTGMTPLGSVERASTNGDGSGIASFSVLPAVSLVTPRFYVDGIVIGSYYYIVGGATGAMSGGALIGSKTLERSLIGTDGTLGPFEAVSSQLIHPRIGAALYASQNKLFVMGGSPDGNTFFSSIEEAPINGDGSLGMFTTSSQALTVDRALAGVIQLGSTLYIIGGASTNNGSASVDAVISIDYATLGPNGNITAINLSQKTLVEKRQGHPHLIGNYVYFVDGNNGDGIAERASIVDPAARFSTFTNSPVAIATPRWGMAPAVVGKYLFLFGGSTFGAATPSPSPGATSFIVRSTINDDGTIGNFTGGGSLPNLFTGRFGASTAVVNRNVYVCGGANGNGVLKGCESFFVGYDGSLTGAGNLTMLTAREHFQLAFINYALYAIGGDFSASSDTMAMGSNGVLAGGNFVASNPNAYTDTSGQKMAIVTGYNDYLIGGSGPSAAIQSAPFTFGVAPPAAFTPASGVTIPSARFDATVLSTGSTAFLIGGLGPVVDMGAGPATSSILASSISYNGASAQVVLGPFSAAGTLSTARQQATGVILGNNVYIIGGADGEGVTANVLGSVEQATIQ